MNVLVWKRDLNERSPGYTYQHTPILEAYFPNFKVGNEGDLGKVEVRLKENNLVVLCLQHFHLMMLEEDGEEETEVLNEVLLLLVALLIHVDKI